MFILRRELTALILIDGTALLGMIGVSVDAVNAGSSFSMEQKAGRIL
ncbi:MAG: hypothetical protein ACKO81_01290 [Planctomycetota bacterium]